MDSICYSQVLPLKTLPIHYSCIPILAASPPSRVLQSIYPSTFYCSYLYTSLFSRLSIPSGPWFHGPPRSIILLFSTLSYLVSLSWYTYIQAIEHLWRKITQPRCRGSLQIDDHTSQKDMQNRPAALCHSSSESVFPLLKGTVSLFPLLAPAPPSLSYLTVRLDTIRRVTSLSQHQRSSLQTSIPTHSALTLVTVGKGYLPPSQH